MGTLFACNPKDVVVPTPEVVGGDEENCDHEYEESEFIEATCQDRAHTVYVCEKCGSSYSIYQGELAPHVLSSRSYKGDCISYGYKENYCTVCGEVVSVEYDTEPGDHKYRTVNRHVAGNCVTLGYTIVQECSVCGEQVRVSDALYGDHAFKKTGHVDATCVSYAYDIYTCTVCGENYYEYGTETVEHEFQVTTKQGSDCKHHSTLSRRCVNCGYTETEELDATGPHAYVSTGDAKHRCAVCGSEGDHTIRYESVSASEHRAYCPSCGYIDEAHSGTHTFTDTVTPATCTTNGLEKHTCNICKYSYSNVLPAKHTYNYADGYVAATCTEDGRGAFTCSVCRKTLFVSSSQAVTADSSVGVAPMIGLTTLAGAHVGDIVEFGTYPQQRVRSAGLIEKLDALAAPLPSAYVESEGWYGYGYMSEGREKVFAWYRDVSYNDKSYRGVYFIEYRPVLETDKYGADRSYVDDNGYYTQKTYWFSYEPMRWRVVSEEDKTLLAESILDSGNSDISSFLRYFNSGLSLTDEEYLYFDRVFFPTATILSSYGLYNSGVYEEVGAKSATDYALCQGAYAPSSDKKGVWWLAPVAEEKASVVRFGYITDLKQGHNLVSVMSDRTLCSESTCIGYACYYKSCTKCSALSDEVFYDVENGYSAHAYVYIVSEAGHMQKCSVCNETLPMEAHSTSAYDDGNGLTHTRRCIKCRYAVVQEHNFSGSTCLGCAAAKITYDSYWDVSENGTDELVAFKSGNRLSFYGKGRMKNYSSTSLPPYAAYRSSITTVALSNNMTTIGSYAFYGFSQLTSIVIPENIRAIGGYAFSGTEKMTAVTFNATDCGNFPANNGVFSGMGASTSGATVTIGAHVYNIPSYFMYPAANTLPNVTNLVFPEGENTVHLIGDYAFASLPVSISSLPLAWAEKIGKYAFYHPRSITSVTLGDRLYSVGDYAFYDCASTVFYGEPALSAVGSYAFYNCRKLTGLRLSGMTTVSPYAFYGTGVINLEADDTLIDIGAYAFYGCNKLRGVILPESLVSVGEYAFYGSSLSGDVLLSELTAVGEYAFYSCEKISSFDAAKLTSVGKNAFCNCKNMTSFSAPSLTTVAESAFSYDRNLREAEFSSDLATVGEESFCGCERLLKFTLSKKTTSIGKNAFTGCFRLALIDNRSSFVLAIGAVNYGSIAAYAREIYNGEQQIAEYTQAGGFILLGDVIIDCDLTGDVTIPSDYTVGAYAFYGNTGLERVTIQSPTVERFAFYGAKALTEVTADGVESIGECAFGGCDKVLNVVLGSSVKAIAGSAFKNDYIDSLTVSGAIAQALLLSSSSCLPSAVVRQVVFTGVEADAQPIGGYTSDKVGETVTYTLESGGLPEDIVISTGTIGLVDYTFKFTSARVNVLTLSGSGAITPALIGQIDTQGKEIVSVVIISGITEIADMAFAGLRYLTDIDIPESVTTIGNNVFRNCESLSRVTVDGSNVDFLAEEGILFNKTQTELISYPAGKEGASYAVPASVISIREGAFFGCGNLEEISLPSSLVSLGKEAFSDCYNVSLLNYDCINLGDVGKDNRIFYNLGRNVPGGVTVVLTDAVESVPAYLFNPVFDVAATSPKITSLTIGSSVESVGAYAFRNLKEIVSVDFPASVTSADRGVLSGTNLTSLTLSSLSLGTISYYFDDLIPLTLRKVTVLSADSIPDYAFKNCYSLQTVVMDTDTVEEIGSGAFYGCSSLTEIGVEGSGKVRFNHVAYVDYNAFSQCGSLTTVELGNEGDELYLDEEVFYECDLLASVTLSDLTYMGTNVFFGCSSLVTLDCEGGSFHVHNAEGAFGIYNVDTINGTADLIGYTGGATAYTIPDTVAGYPVTGIFYGAFAYQAQLEKVVLCGNITSIGDFAFYECLSLKTVDTRACSALESIGDCAFYECRMLRYSDDETDLPFFLPDLADENDRIEIGDWVFQNCENLRSFRVPASTSAIGWGVFDGCRRLRYVEFAGNYITQIPNYAFSECTLLGASDDVEDTVITLPSSVTSIGNEAFSQCSSLHKLILPENLSSIGSYVFSNCKSLISLEMPDTLTFLGDHALNGCIGMKTLVLSASLTTIDPGALSGCGSLEELTVPFVGSALSLTASDDIYPFGYIFGTTEYGGSVRTEQIVRQAEVINEITVYTSKTTVYYLPASLKDVTVRGGKILYGAFFGCSKLVSVDIFNTKVNTIEERAFSGCASLKEIVFPEELVTIKSEAFYYCSSYVDIVLPSRVTDMEKTSIAYTGYYNTAANWYDNVLYVSVEKSSSSGQLCSDKQRVSLIDARLTLDYCDCDVFGKTTVGAEHSDAKIEKDIAEAFDEFAENYAEMMSGYILTDNLNEWKIDPAGEKFDAYSDFFLYAYNLYKISNVSVARTADYDVTSGAVIGINNKFDVLFSDSFLPVLNPVVGELGAYYERVGANYVLTSDRSVDGEKTYYQKCGYDDLMTVVARLFGYSDASTFVRSAQNIVSAIIRDPAGVSAASVSARMKYDGAIYTSENSYIMPFAFKNSELSDAVLAYVFIDNVSGTTSIWLSDVSLAIQTVNFRNVLNENSSVEVFGRCQLFELPCVQYAVDAKTGFRTDCKIKDGAVRILPGALRNTSFTSVTLPDSLQVIGFGILEGNTEISVLSVPYVGETPSTNAYLAYFFGADLESRTETRQKRAANADEAFLPESLKTVCVTDSNLITEDTFSSCRYVQKVELREGTRDIETMAFVACASLAEVSLPASLDSIGAYAFEFCEALTGIIVPEEVTYIGQGAFANCTAMTYYSAPFVGSKETIGDTSFLGYVFWPSTTDNLTTATQGTVMPESLVTVIVSGDGTEIPGGAFYGCANVKTVAISGTIEKIGMEAFLGCSALSKVYIIGTSTTNYSYRFMDSNSDNHRKFDEADKYYIYFGNEKVRRSIASAGEEETYENSLHIDDRTYKIEYSSSDESIGYFKQASSGVVTLISTGVIEVTAKITVGGFIVYLRYELTIE